MKKYAGENTIKKILNSLKLKIEDKASTKYVDDKITEAITKTLNTEV